MSQHRTAIAYAAFPRVVKKQGDEEKKKKEKKSQPPKVWNLYFTGQKKPRVVTQLPRILERFPIDSIERVRYANVHAVMPFCKLCQRDHEDVQRNSDEYFLAYLFGHWVKCSMTSEQAAVVSVPEQYFAKEIFAWYRDIDTYPFPLYRTSVELYHPDIVDVFRFIQDLNTDFVVSQSDPINLRDAVDWPRIHTCANALLFILEHGPQLEQFNVKEVKDGIELSLSERNNISLLTHIENPQLLEKCLAKLTHAFRIFPEQSYPFLLRPPNQLVKIFFHENGLWLKMARSGLAVKYNLGVSAFTWPEKTLDAFRKNKTLMSGDVFAEISRTEILIDVKDVETVAAFYIFTIWLIRILPSFALKYDLWKMAGFYKLPETTLFFRLKQFLRLMLFKSN